MTAIPSTLPGPTAPPALKAQTLGQGDFIRLLTTQLKTQDPLSPMDGTAFVAQLAQFSTVSGIAELNASVATLAGDRAAMLGALIGRRVTTPQAEGLVTGVGLAPGGAATLTLADGAQVALADVRRLSTGDK